MHNLALATAAFAFLTPVAAAGQAALRVQPLTIDVPSPAQASTVTLQNNGKDDLSLQLRVFKWSPAEGRDKVVPTSEVVASPPVAHIAPGSSYTIRLARTAGPVKARTEEAYRLWIDELPPAALVRTGGGQVDVRLRLDLPVYFRGAGTSPHVTANLQRPASPERMVGTLTNSDERIATGDRGGEAAPTVALAD